MRAQYQNTAFGLTMLGATTHAYSTASGGQQNYYNAGASAMPKVFRTIWICNQGSSTLYADVLTELATDDEYNASIKEIELPTKKMIGLVVAAEDPYTIQYSWNPEDEKKRYTFSALEQQKIVFTDQGPNRTVIQTDPISTR